MIYVKPVANYGAQISKAVMRNKVFRLEAAMLGLPQIECPVEHLHADGIYGRQMSLPAGTVITGAIHKTEHITVISKGRIQLLCEHGVEEFSAPACFISKPGVKNAGHVLEDTILTTFHANSDNERDMDILVERYTTSKNSELLGREKNRQLMTQEPAKEVIE